MTDFDATLDDADLKSQEREVIRERLWDFLVRMTKRFVLFVSFGPGVLGVLWLIGKIFKR